MSAASRSQIKFPFVGRYTKTKHVVEDFDEHAMGFIVLFPDNP